MKNIYIAFLSIILIGIMSTGCEKEEEPPSYFTLYINNQEIIYSGGEPDYGNDPFGFFSHLSLHTGNLGHTIELYAGSENKEHYYEGDYIELKINIGSDKVEQKDYPAVICYRSPDFIYCGEAFVSITHFTGTTGYVMGDVDSVVLTDLYDENNTLIINNLDFTVKMFGDSFSVE